MLIGFFIPEEISADNEAYFKATIIIGLLLTYITLSFGGALFMLVSIPTESDFPVFGVSLNALLAAFFCTLLFYFKKTGKINTTTNIVAIVLYLSIASSVFSTGGPLITSVTSLMILPSIITTVLINARWGLIWFFVSLLTLVVLYAMAYNNYLFPNLNYPKHADKINTIVQCINLIAVFGLVLVYGEMNRRYKNERDVLFEKMKHLATHDHLTELKNRSQFESSLASLLVSNDKRMPGNKISLFYLDLDGFKQINDKHGHKAGDYLLKEIAKRISRVVRIDDHVARLGGDEFAIITRYLHEEHDVELIAKKLQDAIAHPIEFQGLRLIVSTSIGIAHYPLHSNDMDELMNMADQAMYKAKKNNLGWFVAALPENRTTE